MIKKSFKLFIAKAMALLSCFLWSNSLLAEVRIEITSTDGQSIQFIVHDWPDEDWVPAPLECSSSCAVGMQISSGNGEAASGQFLTNSVMNVYGANTMGDVSRQWKTRFGLGNSFQVAVASTALSKPNMCLGMKYHPREGMTILPGLTCLGYDPGIPATFCYLQDGAINLNHRTVESSSLEGNTAQVSTNIRCILPANVVLRMSSLTNSQLFLNTARTLYSKISINGSPVTSAGINLRVGAGGVNFPINFLSTLGTTTSDIAPNKYSGSSIMIVEFQ